MHVCRHVITPVFPSVRLLQRSSRLRWCLLLLSAPPVCSSRLLLPPAPPVCSSCLLLPSATLVCSSRQLLPSAPPVSSELAPLIKAHPHALTCT
ncbi:hypothetical protein CgunFtcFv8_025074 [Champsocephalus gunnari]|uniref:Uncharacterized protein n=1 Tax=Champsocephalus gunnari TaxID=52237 RepID=A0AAN8DFP5_CHAGU|nr:hypothetical protein CgunFtcFv8_025074 [Champsocephalus gunnari]